MAGSLQPRRDRRRDARLGAISAEPLGADARKCVAPLACVRLRELPQSLLAASKPAVLSHV
jgi:hypothetical protein